MDTITTVSHNSPFLVMNSLHSSLAPAAWRVVVGGGWLLAAGWKRRVRRLDRASLKASPDTWAEAEHPTAMVDL